MQLITRLQIAAMLSIPMLIPSAHAWRSMDFLEQYDLKDLSYVGMSVDKCGPQKVTYAFFQDREGFTHRAKVGNYLGLNNGVLVQITDKTVKLKEVVQGTAGEWTERDVVLNRTERRAPRARAGYEEEQLLARVDSGARALRHKLVMCRELFGESSMRLRCFDDVIKSLPVNDQGSNWICIPPRLY